MFRLLYLVVLLGGLFWVLQAQPLWLDPERAADLRPEAAAGGDPWQDNEQARAAETFRRIKLVGLATVGVIVASEAWGLFYRRKFFRRT